MGVEFRACAAFAFVFQSMPGTPYFICWFWMCIDSLQQIGVVWQFSEGRYSPLRSRWSASSFHGRLVARCARPSRPAFALAETCELWLEPPQVHFFRVIQYHQRRKTVLWEAP